MPAKQDNSPTILDSNNGAKFRSSLDAVHPTKFFNLLIGTGLLKVIGASYLKGTRL